MTTETSYGARLMRAGDLLNYMKEFPNFNPPRPEENPENFAVFVSTLEKASGTVADLRDRYTITVDARSKEFRTANGSLDKLLAPIRGAVEALYGRKSAEVRVILADINKIRSVKLTKAPADPTNPANEEAVSRSQKSYGSLTTIFGEMIRGLENITGYNPSNEMLTIGALTEKLNRMNTLNGEIATMVVQLKDAVANRVQLFEELKSRVQRIKAYTKAQYGVQSSQYKLIKGLKF